MGDDEENIFVSIERLNNEMERMEKNMEKLTEQYNAIFRFATSQSAVLRKE